MNAIIGQRLVRRVCSSCKVPDTSLDEETLAKIKGILEKAPETAQLKVDIAAINASSFVKGAGCEECHGIGYKGRIGIYEILTITQEIEDNIASEQVSEYVIEEIAIKNGMVTMVQDGIIKALEGVTTIEEIFRVAKNFVLKTNKSLKPQYF